VIPLAVVGHDPALLRLEHATFESEVDRLAARIRDAAREPVEVLGYSMGGRLALGLLARHPALFARAWIIGANPGVASPEEREARARQEAGWAVLLEQRGIEAFVDFWSQLPLFDSQRSLPRAVLERQRARRLRHDPQGLALSLRAVGLAAMPDLRPELQRINAPISFLAGELDGRFLALAREMAWRAPAATVSAIAGSGHNVVLEQPRALAAALMEAIA
jgi:2-succinyl-6-hydroxy-2,4-cyclohexadiene-1-carboxylate synthase